MSSDHSIDNYHHSKSRIGFCRSYPRRSAADSTIEIHERWTPLVMAYSNPDPHSCRCFGCDGHMWELGRTETASSGCEGEMAVDFSQRHKLQQSAKLLSTGGDILLQLVGPAIVGSLFLPILGSLPDALLILVAGLSGSIETAQHHVLVGSGVTTEPSTCHAARIMVISVIPLIIVQLPNVYKSWSGEHVAVLVSLIVSIALLLSYCLYGVFEPRIQERRLQKYAEQKLVIAGILKHVKRVALGRLLTLDGKPNKPVLEKIFQKLNLDCDGYISHSELTALLVGINFEDIDLDTNDAVKRVMEDFDTSSDVKISKEEFIEGHSKWLNVAMSSVSQPKPFSSKFVDDFYKVTKEELNKLISERDKTGESHVWCKAVTLLLLGTVLAVVFADPLVDPVDNFSSATSIPSFFISFIAMPLATNSSEGVSTITFASRK
ncbi:hypothetical protein MRB53_015557 [Persea americana]|uniref:Uncharacterized protein n=1 Tax=Persea americana TaxID=3435 RepID=A0ACC2M074_PERAE|nr:hypothetical protein MRB53_015557 [Persea americana]